MISIGRKNKEFKDYCIKLLKDVFNYDATAILFNSYINSKKYVNYCININSSKIKKFLEFLGVKGNCKNKRIPKCIFSSPLSVRRSFIKGLMDTDGSYAKSGITFCCYNDDLALDFQQLLFTLGIHNTIGKQKIKGYKHLYNTVRITGVEDKYRFLSNMSSSVKTKQKSIQKIIDSRNMKKTGFNFKAPIPIIKAYRKIFSPSVSNAGWFRRALKTQEISLRNLREYVIKFNLNKLKTLNYEYTQIKKITFTKNFEKMYDISIDSNDSLFICNGIAVHNSPIQSAASDLTFLSCIEVFKEIRKQKLKSRLVLTVYDSLVFNVPNEELEYVSKLLYTKMSERPIPEIIIPLVPDIKIGKNWGSLMDVDLNKNWNIIKEELNKKFMLN
jgi:intein/homing endonuclease